MNLKGFIVTIMFLHAGNHCVLSHAERLDCSVGQWAERSRDRKVKNLGSQTNSKSVGWELGRSN